MLSARDCGAVPPVTSAAPGASSRSKANGTSRQWKARPGSTSPDDDQRKSYTQADLPAAAIADAMCWAGARNVWSVIAWPTTSQGRAPGRSRYSATSGAGTPAFAMPSLTMSAVTQSAPIQAMLNSFSVLPAITGMPAAPAAGSGSVVTTSPSVQGANGSWIAPLSAPATVAA